MIRRPPRSTLFPYTTALPILNAASLDTTGRQVITITEALKRMRAEVERGELAYSAAPMERSEEHTSELQSQSNLVCRLLLEKKKITTSMLTDADHACARMAVY